MNCEDRLEEGVDQNWYVYDIRDCGQCPSIGLKEQPKENSNNGYRLERNNWKEKLNGMFVPTCACNANFWCCTTN